MFSTAVQRLGSPVGYGFSMALQEIVTWTHVLVLLPVADPLLITKLIAATQAKFEFILVAPVS